jgi:diguanylate cyclase (GGDEF)-like protein
MTTGNALAPILQLLDGLKKTAEGTMLHSFIARGLKKFGATRVEGAFLVFADKLLERYLGNPEADPATRMRVKVIQQRLRPYLDEYPVTPRAPVPQPTPAAPPPSPATAPRPAVPAGGEALPVQIARQLSDALSTGRELDELIFSSLAALVPAEATEELAELKHQLQRGIEELLDEHHQLGQRLAESRAELQAAQENREQLDRALARAREHSMIDELTGLPNRAAFLKQLNSEIGRARRYGFSLALALLDIDNFRQITDRFGPPAGDAVLQSYGREMQALFRGYDMVARYAGDEFAVLMPNTQREGATRALEKAQQRITGTMVSFNGNNIPLPSFSSVLTLYAHGEPPGILLKRADEALNHAKQRGRAQAVVALPPG